MAAITEDVSRTSIVLVGAWNLAIFRPEWVQERLFADQKINGMLGLNLIGGLRAEFSQEDFVFSIEGSRAEIRPWSNDAAMLARAEQLAIEILKQLPETPINAFGINFGYTMDPQHAVLSKLFSLPDSELLTESGATVSDFQLRRSLAVDGRKLNLVIAATRGLPFQLDLNFHFDIVNAAAAGRVVSSVDGSLATSRQIAERLVRGVYA